LLHLFVLVVINIPLSWDNAKGGPRLSGFDHWVDIGRFELGVSASRAAWAPNWLTEKATQGRVKVGELQEGLGRLQFITGPAELLRPFFGPLGALQGRVRPSRSSQQW
jgi:hypothetical protein